MTEFKGAPGPWEVGVADWSENGDARYSLVGVKEVCINDARLIAAAPELLEALSLVLDNCLDSGGLAAAHAKARAAIAKALGETK